MQGGAGAPLYETLGASFPSGLFPQGMEDTIKNRVRRRLRDIGYRVVFPPDEPWQGVLELFAIAALERMHRGYGENPWFWVVAWPTVFGAAAVDFWPEVGSPAERRMVAADAAAQHLEAILIRAALNDSDAIGALPTSAIRGLRAIGQSTLPAIPTVGPESDVPSFALRTSKSAPGFAATPLFARNLQAGGQLPTAGQQQPDCEPQQGAPPLLQVGQAAAGGAAAPCFQWGGFSWSWMQTATEAYGGTTTVVCDQCHELCGTDAPLNAARLAPFLHCAAERLDLCEACGIRLGATALPGRVS